MASKSKLRQIVLFGTVTMLAAGGDIRYNTGEMVLAVLNSPRRRRRTMWAAGLAAFAGVFALANAFLPHGESGPDSLRPGKVQRVALPREVPLTQQRRRTINELLDAFVPAAVERKNPLRALNLVTTGFRAGVSLREWKDGKLPVFPYDAEGTRFHGWTLNYSLADEMSVDVLLRPGPRETTYGAFAFTAVFKKHGGRWRIDAFIPAASFAPDNAKTSRILSHRDFSPSVKGAGTPNS
jgi:hypothetical protein